MGNKRILIIGDGVIGRCVAYFCRQSGMEVTILERGAENHDGCSFGNAGLVVPSHIIPLASPGMIGLGLKWMLDSGSPFYVKPRWNRDLIGWGWRFFRSATETHVARSGPLIRDLNLASRELFDQFASDWGDDFGLSKTGVLNLCRTEKGLIHENKIAQRARALGLQAETLGASETRKLEPNLRINVVGSVYYPQDCHMDPSRFMAALKGQLDRLGVRFVWRGEFSRWVRAGGKVTAAVAGNEEFEADTFVVCAGAWSPAIVRSLGMDLPLQAGKGYNLTIPNPRVLPRIPAILSEARAAVTPMSGMLRVAGTMEIAGLDQQISGKRVARIIKAACDYFPDLKAEDFEGIKPWHGLRPCSPDGLPYVGSLPDFSNVYLAAGHAMMGLSLGPISGKLISQMIFGDSSELPIELLSPARFSAR